MSIHSNTINEESRTQRTSCGFILQLGYTEHGQQNGPSVNVCIKYAIIVEIMESIKRNLEKYKVYVYTFDFYVNMIKLPGGRGTPITLPWQQRDIVRHVFLEPINH